MKLKYSTFSIELSCTVVESERVGVGIPLNTTVELARRYETVNIWSDLRLNLPENLKTDSTPVKNQQEVFTEYQNRRQTVPLFWLRYHAGNERADELAKNLALQVAAARSHGPTSRRISERSLSINGSVVAKSRRP